MAGTSIKKNFEQIKEKIERAALGSKESARDITLVAVSKKQEVAKVNQAIQDCGHLDFGENYVQEWQEKHIQVKQGQVPSNIRWHFIGALQSNKVKFVVGEVELIHSVDRESLVDEIQKQAAKKGLQQKILVQIDIANEETKGGVNEKNLPLLVKKIVDCENIKLCGFMAFPPLTEDENLARSYFSKCRTLFEFWQEKLGCSDFTILSMGTSSDFEWALAEGANMVRIGSSLFGERT